MAGSLAYLQLKDWATHRHPRKSQRWIANKYWLIDRGEGWTFAMSLNLKTRGAVDSLAEFN
jgi:hypothetical protein